MKYLLVLVAFGAFVSGAYADDMIFALTYEPAVPLSDTRDFIEEASFRGFGIELRRFYNPLSPNVSFSLSWHVNGFSENVSYAEAQWFVRADGDNLIQERRLNASPVLAHVDYHFNTLAESPSWVPYVGCGIGAYWIKMKTQFGDDEPVEDSNWHFALAPEAGFMVPLSQDIPLIIAVRYNYAFKSGTSEHQYLSFSLGFGYATP
jgi:opacity protein-like surface antigen